MFIVSQGAVGSLGGRDIYHSILQDDGTWAEPQNLGPVINTSSDEDAPYITKDGKTLYFASNGHNTMGGYDIFRSIKDENGNWSKPMNVGAPINSAGNDIYYMENNEGTIAYFASQRPGAFGYLDIYQANFECLNIPTTDIKGYAIYADSHQPIKGVIKITNKTTGEEMGSYTVDNKGKYHMVLPPNETYLLEFVIEDNRYTNIRPHQEEFFIPKQCEAYNLFQQIKVNKLKDENGNNIAQKAHFKNAMFDIESEIEKTYGTEPIVNTTYADSTSSIVGTIAFNKVVKAKDLTVTLLNENHEILRITKTDDNGDFAFEHIDNTKPYIVMINEDDAKRNYFGDNLTNGSNEINLQGFVYNINNERKSASQNTSVYLATTEKVITNTTKTDQVGFFEFTSQPGNMEELANLNQKAVTYNLNVPIEEVVFSAYITNLDPENTDLAYTEYIDIIELKDISPSEMPEFANIYFDFDKYFLRNKSKDILTSLYDYMADHPNVTVRLDGHTDWFGTDEYNMVLSENRALSAYKYLIDKGISQDRIVNRWFGESMPAVPNANPDGSDNPENRQLNRRVEIKVDIPEMASIYIQL
jgi:outer membrane protein OmpA-like peptidoglycan-associated protein